MESVGALSVGEWSSFSGMFSSEEADFMVQLLGSSPFPSDQFNGHSFETMSNVCPSHEPMGFDENLYFCPDSINSDSYYLPGGSSNSTNGSSSSSCAVVPTIDQENYYLGNANPMLVTDNSFPPMDFPMVDVENMNLSINVHTDNVMEEDTCLNEEILGGGLGESDATPLDRIAFPEKKLLPKRKIEMSEADIATECKDRINSSATLKKSRVSGSVQRNKKNVQPKKKQKLEAISNDEEETNADLNGQSSSGYSSDDDTNATQELSEGATLSSKGSKVLNSNGKQRASRGSATDPQSLYARKRRERINERLRVLQNLVPNGTKVDISTMLEEAVQYVKFLQLQIKLLSSDDHWMYAPLAYNGMDIGLDMKISLP